MFLPESSTQRSEPKPGRLFRPGDCEPQDVGGCLVREFIDPSSGSLMIRSSRIDIPAGHVFESEPYPDVETIAVVYQGRGALKLGLEGDELQRASTIYLPMGAPFRLVADSSSDMAVYFWRAPLPEALRPSRHPVRVSSLWDDTTNFTPKLRDGESLAPAKMHFIEWPGTDSALLCLHCGIQQPGQMFPVHVHPESEECFIAFEGEGECYLNGSWQPFRSGDVLYAPQGLPHGVRNVGPEGDRFVTCGGPTPFDRRLYELGNVSPEVVR